MDFKAIKLKIASPEYILAWSHGEVTKPETINYRTQRPEKDGLFSERIFGPTKDWECYCGKYRKVRYKGIVCDRCGVEVTRSSVRRERMGHITLAAPVAHIWFLKAAPPKLSLILDVQISRIEKVIYYAAYMITSVNEENKKAALEEIAREFKARKKTSEAEGVEKETLRLATQKAKQELESIELGKVLSETEFLNLSKRFGNVFEAGRGAESVRKVLEQIDLDKVTKEIQKELVHLDDKTRGQKLLRRLKLVEAMRKNAIHPEWMIMTVLPVLPPELRPMVALDGGRFATSDLNDLYRRVINRNNRLKKLIELRAPEVIVVNEKRMLQEAVDALIDNSSRFGSQQLGTQRRPLRSLAEMLKGKQGRFRQNLLGKRVDYSGRSVIVVGPHLKLGECGLPKRMALELFKPFVISKIIDRGLAHNIRNANRLIESATPEVWGILEEVIADKKVLLNRAPTLHRLGVQAFKPLLIEDLAIQIPPMVCSAFNADFDGDQMAVHLPLSDEAQREATELMWSVKNLLKPATGEPITVPSQDIVLGSYYLTKVNPNAIGTGKVLKDVTEVNFAYETKTIALNALIKVRMGKDKESMLETTHGRLIFNNILPEGFEFVNETMGKKPLAKLVGKLIHRYGIEETVPILDRMKFLGTHYATRSGISWGMDDLQIPKEKKEIIKKAEEQVAVIRGQYNEGLLTNEERKARVISIWETVRAAVAKLIPATLGDGNSVHSIIDSGARGSWGQPVQMAGMKGLVVNPKNETIELPIKASYKEGFSVLEYFIASHGARKGSTDTALKTAQAGYLTRRLIDVVQDVVVKEEDCHTKEGIEVIRTEGAEFGHSFASRLFSRTPIEDIKIGNKVIAKTNETIDAEQAEEIEKTNIAIVKVKSPITCKTLYGVCAKCYGFDLSNNALVKKGTTVGILAAQSIGEPGTQLTLRTFHSGGVAGADITYGLPRVEELFETRPPKGKGLMTEDDGHVVKIEERGSLKVIEIGVKKGKSEKTTEYPIPRFNTIFVKVGDEVKKGDRLSEGSLDLKELFALKGKQDVYRYIVKEVQKIYVSEGASISNKHIEVIVRQMFAHVKIVSSGDTDFVRGEVVEKSKFFEVNRATKRLNGEPARAEQLLLGITKAALRRDGFLSAASFQETARVLVEAASEGKIDYLRGLKENVIIGRLLPVSRALTDDTKEEESKEEEVGTQKEKSE